MQAGNNVNGNEWSCWRVVGPAVTGLRQYNELVRTLTTRMRNKRRRLLRAGGSGCWPERYSEIRTRKGKMVLRYVPVPWKGAKEENHTNECLRSCWL